jgi:hypothetical protein
LTTPSYLQFPVTTQPTICWQAGQGQVTFYNVGTNTVNIALGTTNNITPTSINSIILIPGQSVTLPGGNLATWCVASAACSLLIVPGAANFAFSNLEITGPVTAEISGPVTVEGNVGITGTVNTTVTGTVDVDVTGGSVTVTDVGGTVDVIGEGGYILTGQSTLIATLNDVTLGAPGADSTAVIDGLTYNAYDLQLSCYCNGAQGTTGAPNVLQVIFYWYEDSAGDNLVYTEVGWIWVGNNASDEATLFISGPMHGRYFQIQFINQSTAIGVFIIQMFAYGTNRTLQKSTWNQEISDGLNPGSTLTQAFSSPLTNNGLLATGYDNVLLNVFGVTLAASTKYWQPLPLFVGEVSYYMQTNAAFSGSLEIGHAANLETGQINPGSGIDSPGILLNSNALATANAELTGTLYAPRAPLYIAFETGTTAPEVAMSFIGVENR